MNTFFSEDFDGTRFQITGQESNHLARVLRLKRDDQVNVINNSGILYECRLTEATPSFSVAEVINSQNQLAERHFRLHIAIAPTKNNERLSFFMEKCVEIGIDEITPIICSRSERRKFNAERFGRVVLSARKQSAKAFPTKLNRLTTFDDFIGEANADGCFIATCNKMIELPTLPNVYQPGTNALILIGPEGDFNEKEVNDACSSGFKPVSLGPSVMRTETAGIVTCSTIYTLNL